MSNGVLLFITFTIPILIVTVVQIILYRKRKKDPLIYDELWSSFLKSKDTDNYEKTYKLGRDIVYNSALNRDHLHLIFKVANDFESVYPKFETLKYDAYKRMPRDQRPTFYS